jgi:hypothetical protein
MKTLTQIFNEAGGDKGSYFTHVGSTENIAHNYTQTYEKIMSPNRNDKFSLLEIGIWCPYFPGSSVKSWPQYFENATYYGIDIVDCRQLEADRVKIDIVYQRSPSSITRFIKDKPKFKFIIDDGCHEEDAIVISLGHLFPMLESGGVYFIEDLHVVDKTNLYKLINKNFNTHYIDQDKVNYINNNIEKCYFENNDKLLIIHKK